MFLVTGGAEFIGSNLVSSFNGAGRIGIVNEVFSVGKALSFRDPVSALFRAGTNVGSASLKDGGSRYVTQFLNTADRYR
jgi:nucleoside-diphosphate-sugar epimerase